jgi:EAL domain-containing protein (putative c-di-GMP-specific phosphodiesterase class I)
MQFDINYLKIDRSFVRDVSKNKGGQAIVESVITMAHRLGLQVIAEGIEEPEQEAFLRKSGCDFGQGYLFSRPVPAHRMENLLLQQAG